MYGRNIYLGTPGMASNKMVQGMAEYLNLRFPTVYANPTRTPEKYGPFTFRRLTRRDIFRRPNLTLFNSPSLGPAPHVDLSDTSYFKQTSESPVILEETDMNLHRLYMLLAFNRVIGRRIIRRGVSNYLQNYNIGAVFATKSGQVLAIATNMVKNNYTYHAEVNLIQAIVKKYPKMFIRNPYIYSTLKPCKMCHGMIRAVYPNATVIFSQDDLGGHARYTHSKTHHLVDFSKPLRTYSKSGETLVKNKSSSVGRTLDGIYQSYQYQHRPPGLVKVLRYPKSLNTMQDAAILKYRIIYNKYFGSGGSSLTHNEKTSQVTRALNHLAPAFLNISGRL